MFYCHGITAIIIALYGGGVKLCRVELPGFPGVYKDPAASGAQPGPLSRNFPPLSRRKRPQKRDVPPCPGTENRAVYALAVFPAVQ